MNILYICNEYPPFPHGGIGTFTQTIANGLREMGNKVVVVGIYKTLPTRLSFSEENGVLVCRLRQKRGFHGFFRSRLRLYWEVKKIIKKHSIQIVEVPDYFGMLAFWPRLPVPVVVRLHGSVTYFLEEMGQQLSRHFFKMEKDTLKKASAIIGVSTYTANKTRILFKVKSPTPVIYNSIRFKPFENLCESNREFLLVVFTGTLMKKKGVFPLIEAWQEVVKRIPQARLRMFGKDSLDENGVSIKSLLYQELPESLRDSVTFYGHVGRDRILNELRTASVAVFPSFSETFGFAPVEAMSEGCPTIFTKLATGPEIINDGVDGILVDPARPQEITDAIVRILSDRKFAAAIGVKGRETVQSRFSNKIILLQNEKMYRNLIEQKNMKRN